MNDNQTESVVSKWERLVAARPESVPLAMWKGAVALALLRHPTNCWPQPADLTDSLTVLSAAAPSVL